MPELTVREVTDKSGSLVALLNAKKIDVYVSFRLTKFNAAVVKVLKNVEEKRNALIEQFGVENEKGVKTVEYSFLAKAGKLENVKLFNDQMEKLMAEKVVLPNVIVKVRELEHATYDIECPRCRGKVSIGMMPADIMNLDFILDQEDTGKETKVKTIDEVREERRK